MNQQIKYCLYFSISPVYEQVKLILVVSHVLTRKQTRCQHVVNFTKFLCPLNGIGQFSTANMFVQIMKFGIKLLGC